MSQIEPEKKETTAYRASQEIHQILHTAGSGLYAPWQLQDYKPIPVTLKTTYEELFLIWKEEAKYREGFDVIDGKVYIPTIFAKLNGAPEKIDEYWKGFNQLVADPVRTILFESIPLKAPIKFMVEPDLLDASGRFDVERVKRMREYSLGFLKTPVQNLLLNKLNDLIEAAHFFTFPITEDFKFKALYCLLKLDRTTLNIIQQYDYPCHIPKLVIFDGNGQSFTHEDLIIIMLLHLCAFDIIILTPTGYNNIEKGVNPSNFHTHHLDKLLYNLKLPHQQKQEEEHWLKKFFFWLFQ